MGLHIASGRGNERCFEEIASDKYVNQLSLASGIVLIDLVWGCVATSSLITFPWVIALSFCITDIQAVLNGPVGRLAPLTQIVYNISGGDLSTTIGVTWFFLFLSTFVGGPSVLTATSRIVWSFAREGALPPIFGQIHPRLGVPVNAIILCWAVISAMSFIYVGNETAFYGISSGVTVVMIFSYSFPIMIDIMYPVRNESLPFGSFQLGRAKWPVNVGAVCWSIYLMIFMCFPSTIPVTQINMNYSVVIFAFPFVLAGITWFSYGRKIYKAPFKEDCD